MFSIRMRRTFFFFFGEMLVNTSNHLCWMTSLVSEDQYIENICSGSYFKIPSYKKLIDFSMTVLWNTDNEMCHRLAIRNNRREKDLNFTTYQLVSVMLCLKIPIVLCFKQFCRKDLPIPSYLRKLFLKKLSEKNTKSKLKFFFLMFSFLTSRQ